MADVAQAAEPFGPGDLAGTWSVHGLTASGDGSGGPAALRGILTLDNTGAVLAGSIEHGGSATVLSGGQLSVTADGLVVGLLQTGVDDTLQVAQIVEARMLPDRQVIVGLIAGGDFGDVIGPDFGLITLVKHSASGLATHALAGTWWYHELRTPAVSGAPATSLVGDITFDDTGMILGGTLAVGDAATTVTGTSASTDRTGVVAGTVTATPADWLLEGHLSAAGDWIAATTAPTAVAASGLALMNPLVPGQGLTTAQLGGTWRLYVMALDGDAGTFLRGSLVLSPAGKLTSGELVDPAGVRIALVTGALGLDTARGHVTGTLGGGGSTLVVDGTLRGAGDLVSAVVELTMPSGSSRGLLTLVRAVSALRFESSGYSVAEGAPAEITVLRDGDISAALEVQLRATGPRFGDRTLPLSFAAGATARTITVPLVEHTMSGDEAVSLSLEALPANVVRGPPATLSITANDEVSLQFDASGYTVTENAGTATITVVRTGPTTGTSSVTYATSDGTARAGADYTPTSGRLTFRPGERSKTFPVAVLEDTVDEEPETVLLTLSNPEGALLGRRNTSVLTIVDNDRAGTVQFEKATLKVSETAPAAAVVVKRTGGTAGAVTVDYATSDESARAGEDYAQTSGTLTFAAGEQTKTIFVPIFNDRLVDPDETFRVTLSNPGGGAILGTPAEIVVTIQDDDAGGTIRFSTATMRVSEPVDAPTALVTLTVQRTGDNLAGGVSVQYATSDGTAMAGSDYVAAAGQLVFGPGETTKTIQLTINGDTFDEADETFTVTLSKAQGGARLGEPATAVITIVDPTPSVQFDRAAYAVEERAGSAALTLVRSGPTTGTVSVQYATQDIPSEESPTGRALAGSHYRATSGVVTFRPGDGRKSISVPILANAVAEESESFRVVLSNPQGLALGANNPVVVTILDSARRGTVQFAEATSIVREGRPASVMVTRTGGTDGTVLVTWSATGGTATAGQDYTPARGTLTFGPGITSRPIMLTTVPDTLPEGDETIVLTLGPITGNATLGSQVTHTLTIQDDDVAGTVAFTAEAYTVQEGEAAVVTIRRTGGAASGVVVSYTTEDLAPGPGAATAGVDYTSTSGTLTFGAGETTKTITIPTSRDDVVEADESFRVRLTGIEPAPFAVLGSPTSAIVTIVDRQARLAFRDPVVAVTEGQTATVTVTRSGSPAGTVFVRYATQDGTAVEGRDYVGASGVLTFGPSIASRSFTVTTRETDAVDGSRTVGLRLTDPESASLGRMVAELRIDDKQRPGTLTFAQAAYTVVEGDVAELTVIRTGGSDGTVSVSYAVTGGSATAGVDYVLEAGTLVLQPGQTSATLLVPTVSDGQAEGTETVIVQLGAPTAGATLGAPASTTLFIVDREQTVAFGAAAFAVSETDKEARVSIVRSGLPTGSITVTVRSEGRSAMPGLDYETVATTITFGPGDTLKTVRVPILPGARNRSGNRTLELVLAGDAIMLGTPAVASVTILDSQADLVFVGLATPPSALTGKGLSAPLSVRNAGRMGSPSFNVGIFLARAGVTGAGTPGAGTLLGVQSIRPLPAGDAMGVTTLLNLADDLPSGTYWLSAIADLDQVVPEADENNNAFAAPQPIQINRGLGKFTSASATLSQGNPPSATLAHSAAAPAVGGDCDAAGTVSLNGIFQIGSQIGNFAQATARLTGTLNDQPVEYVFQMDLTIAADNTVTGPFRITDIVGAFSGTGDGTFTGALVDRVLQGDISGTIATSTERSCSFSGTLRAAGDVSFTLGLEQRAQGGTFAGTSVTPVLATPVAVGEYLANFRVLFDADFPPAANVAFTGPGGSGLTGTPASGRRSETDADGAAATYVSPLTARPGGGPGGAWTVRYKDAPRAFTIPEPGTERRLVLAVPSVVIDGTGFLTRVDWQWADRRGTPMPPPPFVGRVRVRLESSAGLTPLYESPALLRGNTSHTLTLAVLWEDVAELAMLYQDTVTGHEYRVAYPREQRAFAELETLHAVDKTGTRDGAVLTLTFVAPAETVDRDTPGAVSVTAGELSGEPVPFHGRIAVGDGAVDVFRLRRAVGAQPPTLGSDVLFTVVPRTGSPQTLRTSLRTRAFGGAVVAPNIPPVQFTNLVGTLEADAMLGVRRLVSWTLPPPAANGGFDVETITLSGTVRAPDGIAVCPAETDEDLAPDATSGFVRLPAGCQGQPVDSAEICVAMLGTGSEQVRACHTFGPDDVIVGLDQRYTVTEGATAVIRVTRGGPTRKRAIVSYATVDDTAIHDVDYTAVAGTLTFEPGNTEARFNVVTLVDTLARGTRTAIIRLADPSPGVVIPAGSNNSPLSINDDEQGGVIQFTRSTFRVLEGGRAALTLTRAGTNLASGVTVDYQVVGGTAINGIDYTLASGTLSFGAGQTTHSIDVPTIPNTLAQGSRTVVVRLVNPRGGGQIPAPGETTLTIDDDEQGGVIQFEKPALTVTEATRLLDLTVVRTGTNLGGNVSVDYRVGTASTAVAGLDFVLAAGTLTFAAGQTKVPLTVQLLDDTVADGTKVLVIDLLNPRGGNTALGPVPRITITINDNEQEIQFLIDSVNVTVTEGGRPAVLTVVRTGPTNGSATVQFATADGSARVVDGDYVPNSGVLSFGPGITSLALEVRTGQDSLAEGDETFFVNLFAPSPGVVLGPRNRATVTIVDDEQGIRFTTAVNVVAEGQVATIQVTRTGPATTTTLVDYTTVDGSALVGRDYETARGTLTFARGVTTQTFTVTTKNNTVHDGERTLALELSNPRALVFPPVAVALTRAASKLSITDEEQGGFIEFSAATASTSERRVQCGIFPCRTVPLPLTVNRTGTNLASAVTVDYRVIGGTASPGRYSLPSGTLSFGAGQESASITVDIFDNAVADGDRTVVIELTNPLGGGVLGAKRQLTLTIVDDEQELQFALNLYAVSEGGVATLTVTRTGPTAGTATVNFATIAGGTASAFVDYQPTSGTLTFGPGITNRTISVTTLPDTLAEPAKTVLVELSNPSAGAVLGPRALAVLSIVNDDEGGTVGFDSSAVSVVEGGTAKLAVTRSGKNLASGVTVGYQVVGGTAVNGVDYNLASGTLTFAAGQTTDAIPVPTVQNTIVDGTRTVTVRLVSFLPTGLVTAGLITQTTLSILDDDQGGTIEFSPAAIITSERRSQVCGGFFCRSLPLSVTVQRSGKNLASGVTVDYRVVGGTAVNGQDYSLTDGTLTFGPDQTSATLSIPIIDNTRVDFDRTVLIDLVNPHGGAIVGAARRLTLTIQDDEQAVQFAVSSYAVAEGGVATISVTRSGPTDTAAAVQYATVPGGTAIAGSDYIATSGTLSFAAGQTSATFTVTTLQDALFEGNETVILQLSNPNPGVLLGPRSQATLVIVDDEQRVRFAVPVYSVLEGDGVVVTVIREGPANGTVSVGYTTLDGSALAGRDYVATSGFLTFGPGVTSQNFTVRTLTDLLFFESTETFGVNLINPSPGLQIGSPSGTVITIPGGILIF